MEQRVLTDDDFNIRYNYDNSVASKDFDECQAGMFETYGPDIDHVLSLANDPNNAKRVWTMIDGNDGMYLFAGYHLVNRIYYVITVEEWEDVEEAYLIQSYDENEEEN